MWTPLNLQGLRILSGGGRIRETTDEHTEDKALSAAELLLKEKDLSARS